MKRGKKDFWEKLFIYPSFNIRFFTVVILILSIFIFIAYITFNLVKDASNRFELANLLVQSATLVLGIFAAYYALRQLIETRFNNLDESGTDCLKRKHYLRAIRKWKEAFYIKPDMGVFSDLAEAFLLQGDFESFDNHLKTLQLKSLIKPEIFEEESDQLTLLYLEALRHLLVKNQGEAEKKIREVVKLGKEPIVISKFGWDFSDLRDSEVYKNLLGECKRILDNLINYLSKNLSNEQIKAFENGDFVFDSLAKG